MAEEKTNVHRALPVLTVITFLVVGALILMVPVGDDRGFRELSKVSVGLVKWEGVPPEVLYKDLQARLAQQGQTRWKVSLAEGIDLGLDTSTIWMGGEQALSAAEYAKACAEFAGHRLYTTSDGLVIDAEYKDYRTWRKKLQDWFKALPKRFDPPDPFLPAGHRPSYAL